MKQTGGTSYENYHYCDDVHIIESCEMLKQELIDTQT